MDSTRHAAWDAAVDFECSELERVYEVLEGTGAKPIQVGFALDGLIVFLLENSTPKALRALKAAGYRYSTWRPRNGYLNLRGWH